MSTSADPALPADRWASLLPDAMRSVGEFSFDNGVVVRRFTHRSYDAPEMPACEHHLFAYRLSGTVTAERKLGSVWRRAVTRRGSITVVPALRSTSWRLRGEGEILHFYLPSALLQRIGEDELEFSADAPVIEHLGTFDPRLGNLVETFASEVGGGVAGHALYAEAVTTQIAVCLMRHHSTRSHAAGHGTARLRRSVEERLAEYIDANLQRTIGLSDLAALADLGLAQFSKRFKASFGFSPYQYVLRRRIEWAKTLLRDDEAGLAEIATEVGFAHQAHFTTMFKRMCGSTPAVYRADLRS